MKRLLCFLLVVVLFMSIGFHAFADDTYVVSADAIKTKQGAVITVPLKLTGNKGLMGFRISIKYPNNQLVLTDVSSGSITRDGLFNSTITDYYSVKGKFDVVWSESKEVKDDGTLFIMTYQVKETAEDGEYNISVTYSQDDTFNEDFKDVKMSCSPVKVYIGDVQQPTTKSEQTTEKQSTPANDKDSVSDDYLISSLNQVIDSFGKNDVNSLTEKQQETAVEYVNNRIESYGGGKRYESFEELRQDYVEATINEASRKITESTDPDVIISAAEEVLKEYGVDSFSQIPAEKKQEAAEKMLEKLAEAGADESGMQHIGSVDDVAEALDKAVDTAKVDSKEAFDVTPEGLKKSRTKRTVIIISISIVVAIVAAAISIIVIKRKRGSKG